jgi:hypothetical protein
MDNNENALRIITNCLKIIGVGRIAMFIIGALAYLIVTYIWFAVSAITVIFLGHLICDGQGWLK